MLALEFWYAGFSGWLVDRGGFLSVFSMGWLAGWLLVEPGVCKCVCVCPAGTTFTRRRCPCLH